MEKIEQENAHVVRLGSHITELLKRVIHTRSIITVETDFVEESFNSALLKVVPDQYLILDELKPSPRLHSVRDLIGQVFNIQAYVDGVALEFDTRVIASGVQDDVRYYKTSFPREMLYEQKRGSFRVSTTIDQKIPVKFQLKTGESYKGELFDISSGGISIALRQDVMDSRIPRGVIIPQCTIQLPGVREPFECQLELRNIRQSGRMQLIGTSFYKLSPRQERIVEKYVATLDRKRLRQLMR
ncbi:MAG: flagellar brake protein [Gammaproteobacteria bacterium]|nr:flagellar brake protein [Gammaproteobacteria bacterium]